MTFIICLVVGAALIARLTMDGITLRLPWLQLKPGAYRFGPLRFDVRESQR